MKGLGVKILGVGSYLPGKPVTNLELKERYALEFNTEMVQNKIGIHTRHIACLLYTSPSPRDRTRSRMPSSA